jgi:chromosome partitioning protein
MVWHMNTTLRAAAFPDKGGVGKTTTITHVGVALADEGYKVCLLDLAGKQGDLTKHFGLWQEAKESDDWPNITTVF